MVPCFIMHCPEIGVGCGGWERNEEGGMIGQNIVMATVMRCGLSGSGFGRDQVDRSQPGL
jgi:hypothetical protein